MAGSTWTSNPFEFVAEMAIPEVVRERSDFVVPDDVEEKPMVRVYNGVDYSRQMGLFNPFEHTHIRVTVVGAGAIGSMTTLLLAKQGYRNIEVWDDDIVTPENLPNQFFTLDTVGEKKVVALAKVINMFTGVEIKTHDKRWDEKVYQEELEAFRSVQKRSPIQILIMATDNMASRKQAWDWLQGKYLGDHLYVDARMGGLTYRVFMQDGHTMHQKKPYPLYTDEQASTELCTQKSIIFNVASVASTVVSWVYSYLKMTNHEDWEHNPQACYDRTFGSCEMLGDMVNMRIADGMEVTKLM